jgi:hypothetical protein
MSLFGCGKGLMVEVGMGRGRGFVILDDATFLMLFSFVLNQ